MKCLHIQLHPCRCEGNVETHVSDLTAIASGSAANVVVNVDRGFDDGPYININIYADSAEIAAIWSSVSSVVFSSSSLASATIVCCEGENGWDDYTLLHHYDKSEPLDTLS